MIIGHMLRYSTTNPLSVTVSSSFPLPSITDSSTVKLSPESFAQPENYLQDNETEAKVWELQKVVAEKNDAMQQLRVSEC